MAVLGLPVPPAFVLPISLCAATVAGSAEAVRDLADGLTEGMAFLENATGKRLGDRRRPLLVSVRSGAARSMPGMLETVLDVGCTAAAVRGLVRMTGQPRFAIDCRRRFLESYGEVVLGVDRAAFAKKRDSLVAAEGVSSERALDCEALERLVASYEQIIEDVDRVLSDDPMEHLKSAAQAVFRSWTSDRACTYRKLQHLEDLQGTAVTVSATAAFRRAPASRFRAILRPAPLSPSSTCFSIPRAKTWCRVDITPKPKSHLRRRFQKSRRSCANRCGSSSRISPTYKTPSSPSKTAGCGCCRRVQQSERRKRRCDWQ
jgi:phosphoenolpyruvate synthase/pyruvate phosphate dikinase